MIRCGRIEKLLLVCSFTIEESILCEGVKDLVSCLLVCSLTCKGVPTALVILRPCRNEKMTEFKIPGAWAMVRLSGATQTRLSRAGRWRSVWVRFCSLQVHPGVGFWDTCGSGAVERRLAGTRKI